MLSALSAEHAAHDLRAARADQAGDTEDLPLSHIEMRKVDLAAAADVPRFQRDVADLSDILGVFVLQRTADDHIDQLV